MKNFFITGTDTNVGKTIISAALTLALQGCYWKPIQSGMTDEVSDLARVQDLTQLSHIHFIASNYALGPSLSPDQAAKLENKKIDINHIHIPTVSLPLIIEGAGGVFVPLNDDTCMLDLMKKCGFPIVIVSRGTLGTINHTVLTIEVLRQHGLDIQGIVFSGELNKENQYAIEKWGKVKTLFHFPLFENMNSLALKNWVETHGDSIRGSFI